MNKIMRDRIDILIEKARCGDAKAQHDLAECFYSGKLVEKSRDQAMYWAFKAVSSGVYGDSFYYKMVNMEESKDIKE